MIKDETVHFSITLQVIFVYSSSFPNANGYIKDQFGENATVFTPEILAGASEQSRRVISRTLGEQLRSR